MSVTPDGVLHDYFGGQADLAAGRVRFVGDPATRIAEDRLRILRFFRFFAWYGRGALDEAALAACKGAAHTVPSLSRERVQAEMMKLLAAPAPVPAIETMREIGVLYHLLPGAQKTALLTHLVKIVGSDTEPDPIRRLAALVAAAENLVGKAVADRWRLSADDGARLTALTTPEFALVPDLDGHAQRRLIYRLGPERFRDLVLLAWATETKDENEAAWRTMLETAETWQAPPFPVTGADVMARAIPEGPEVGDLLREVEDWWIASTSRPTARHYSTGSTPSSPNVAEGESPPPGITIETLLSARTLLPARHGRTCSGHPRDRPPTDGPVRRDARNKSGHDGT